MTLTLALIDWNKISLAVGREFLYIVYGQWLSLNDVQNLLVTLCK